MPRTRRVPILTWTCARVYVSFFGRNDIFQEENVQSESHVLSIMKEVLHFTLLLLP